MKYLPLILGISVLTLPLVSHHNPLWNTSHQSLFGIGYAGREELLRMIERYKVNAVFAGHVHFDDITILNDTIFITTTTAASATRGMPTGAIGWLQLGTGPLFPTITKSPNTPYPSITSNVKN